MPSEHKDRDSTEKVKEHRDFPRLPVDTKVRVAGTATDENPDQPGELSDLSLGGARLRTPALLEDGDEICLVPFAELEDDHPLKRTLEFQIMWRRPGQDSKWHEYGLAHSGSVLDVLHSWLGHLLLRQEKEESHLVQQQREHSRLRFDKSPEQRIVATASHADRRFKLALLDVAQGGLLARSEEGDLQVGMHLSLEIDVGAPPLFSEPLSGCVVDKHNQFDSTFYRIAFDPDSELELEVLARWAELVDGELIDN